MKRFSRAPQARVLLLSLFILLLFSAPVPAAPPSASCPPDFLFSTLTRAHPLIRELGAIAGRHGLRFGIYGGTVRDLFLGRPFSPISDLDLVYDSSAAGWPAFRDEVLAFGEAHRAEMPGPDFHWDLSPASHASDRQELYHGQGITATKVGVMADGALFDPTGVGVADLRARLFRYRPARSEPLELENLGRFVRDLVRLIDFRRDEATVQLLRSSAARFRDPATDEGRRAREAARACRALGPGHLTFPGLIGPFRRDLRYLHDGQPERVTACFPVDLFVFELFKSVTQAKDMAGLREGLALVGVPDLLASLGLAEEAALLMDRALTREDLFRRFQFPGHLAVVDRAADPFVRTWEAGLRRYAYRTLFDMLASEFSAGSGPAKLLQRKRDAFLSPGSWDLLNPGDDFGEEVVGFVDGDLNLGLLPREKVEKSLAWFRENYFPYGSCTLSPLTTEPAPLAGDAAALLARGWSPEVLAVPRDAPHGMADLDGYLAGLTGADLAPLYLDRRTSLAFLDADHATARAALSSLGFSDQWQVNAPGFSRRVRTLLGYDRRRDRVCLAQYGFHGDEQLLAHQSRLYFVLRRRGGAPASDSLFVLRRRGRDDFPGRSALVKLLDAEGGRVHALFVNFVNPLRSLLRDPRLVTVGDLRLVLGELPRSDGRRELCVGLSGFGACYGSLPGRVARLLAPRGLAHVVLVGTGGGVLGVERRFQWVLPARVGLAGPPWGTFVDEVGFVNRAAALDLPGALRGATHATVAAPLFETQGLVRELRRAAVNSVDCELHHVVAAVCDRRAGGSIHALINVTDFPLPPEAGVAREGGIAVENAPEQAEAVARALELVVRDLATDR